jgi:hypothetical protein
MGRQLRTKALKILLILGFFKFLFSPRKNGNLVAVHIFNNLSSYGAFISAEKFDVNVAESYRNQRE